MKKHEKFIYHSYKVDENGFEFHFSMGQYQFRPKWTCDVSSPIKSPNDPVLKELIFNLGMVELVSYWKSACPKIVEIQCGILDEWQIAWWKKLYLNGLGEFFYLNKITPTEDFMKIVCPKPHVDLNQTSVSEDKPNHESLSGCLIPVGGGKDSIVTLELLSKSRAKNLSYIIGDVKRAFDSAKTAGYSNSQIIGVHRTIDPVLLELNRKGYLNGHTPFSAIVAFSSLIFAYLSRKKHIVLSNENSANEGNCQLGEMTVNHQYSKSIEFESDFREYVSRISLANKVELPNYFSLLRPWNELQITGAFTQFPKYFSVFQSCNAGTKSNIWCAKCAKCLYVYIMLSAFIDDEQLLGIFGENLIENPDLSEIFVALKNPKHDKPFECVGTRDEVNQALAMAAEHRSSSNLSLSSGLYSEFDNNNFVPEEFLELLYDFW
ncbi:MAG: hypothetical protein FWF76_02720 [Oscillospiraceae bacterium]|nr:hypothetical protein [Oscillospiraceae bacterium]